MHDHAASCIKPRRALLANGRASCISPLGRARECRPVTGGPVAGGRRRRRAGGGARARAAHVPVLWAGERESARGQLADAPPLSSHTHSCATSTRAREGARPHAQPHAFTCSSSLPVCSARRALLRPPASAMTTALWARAPDPAQLPAAAAGCSRAAALSTATPLCPAAATAPCGPCQTCHRSCLPSEGSRCVGARACLCCVSARVLG
jgi:hypothetical protein